MCCFSGHEWGLLLTNIHDNVQLTRARLVLVAFFRQWNVVAFVLADFSWKCDVISVFVRPRAAYTTRRYPTPTSHSTLEWMTNAGGNGHVSHRMHWGVGMGKSHQWWSNSEYVPTLPWVRFNALGLGTGDFLPHLGPRQRPPLWWARHLVTNSEGNSVHRLLCGVTWSVRQDFVECLVDLATAQQEAGLTSFAARSGALLPVGRVPPEKPVNVPFTQTVHTPNSQIVGGVSSEHPTKGLGFGNNSP